MQIKKQQLEPDMEPQTGSKLGQEYVKAVYCHPTYLTYVQSSVQFSSVIQSCPTLYDPMDCSTPGLLVLGMVARPWSSSRLSSGERLLLRCDGNAGILSLPRRKGSLLSSYEAETGLLWMSAGFSCFLSSGDEYVGELLEVQQGCEGPSGSSRG